MGVPYLGPAPASADDMVDKEYADTAAAKTTISFTVDQASVGAGVARWYTDRSRTISNIVASAGVAPVGASLIFDVNINGTTAFTTQGNRPTLAAGTFYDGSSVPDITNMVAGDYLTIDFDQVGSSVPGSGIVITIIF